MQHRLASKPVRPFFRALVMLGLSAVIGCGPGAPARPAGPPAADACAARLHDLAGGLLFEVARAGRLPGAIEALANNPMTAEVPRVCPGSEQPYLYFPQGLPMADGKRLVLLDPEPSHAGGRWAVTMTVASPPVPHVVWIEEQAARRILGQ